MVRLASHERAKQEAMLAIDKLHADTGVSKATTKQSLEELRDHITHMIDALVAEQDEDE